jgi:hypothetical protein
VGGAAWVAGRGGVPVGFRGRLEDHQLLVGFGWTPTWCVPSGAAGGTEVAARPVFAGWDNDWGFVDVGRCVECNHWEGLVPALAAEVSRSGHGGGRSAMPAR